MNTEFEVHMLNEDGIAKAKEIANQFDATLEALMILCNANSPIPTGYREFSIVRTKLEEASFFAKKCMAIQPINQKKS